MDDGILEKLQEVEGPSYKEILRVDNNIYGGGGFNRYFINVVVDGELRFETLTPNEVVFSAFHSTVDGIKRAERAGFTIFD
jgi:hypothetical protein